MRFHKLSIENGAYHMHDEKLELCQQKSLNTSSYSSVFKSVFGAFFCKDYMILTKLQFSQQNRFGGLVSHLG